MADMSIAALKAKVTANDGFQRSNRFVVTITNSEFFDETGANETDQNGGSASFYAESVLLPNVSLITQADGLAGPGAGRTVPRGVTYRGGVLITFPIFGNLVFLNGINEWFKKIFYKTGNLWVTDFYDNVTNSRTAKLEIQLLNLAGTVSGTYTFLEVFPVEIAPINLDMTKNNLYMTTTVRFAFRDYTFS